MRRLASRVVLSAVVAGATSGCAGAGWYYSYAEAEQARQRERQTDRPERDLLLFYKDHLDAQSGQMQDVLASPAVRPLIADKIRCVLVTDFALNQRYMAQYGVDSAPALVVVHPDGTCHARSGLLTAEQARDFLSGAVGPGSTPKTTLQVLPVPDYHWHGSYEHAVALAERQNRPLLILYKWWLSADSTELLRNRLSRPRVRRHFSKMVHCLLDWDYVPNRAHVGKYGVSKVPSLIVLRPDGTYHTLVGLPTVERIVRFAVSTQTPGRTTPTRRRSTHEGRGLGITPQIHWQYSYERASSVAQRKGHTLFVFYHSVFSDASNRSARMFDTPEGAAILDGVICCRLDWVVEKNREIAARFDLTEPPGFLVLRPDGSHDVRSGPITFDELSALLKTTE